MVEGAPKSLVALAVGGVLAMLLLAYVLVGVIPLMPHEPVASVMPPGPIFSAGNAVESVCPASGSFSTTGCTPGEFIYALLVEVSTVTFGEVLFQVETQNGAIYDAVGDESGFSIMDPGGAPVAQFTAPDGQMSMTSGWTYSVGTNASTPLTTIYTIVLDMGSVDPQGHDYQFIASLSGKFPGSAFLTLP